MFSPSYYFSAANQLQLENTYQEYLLQLTGVATLYRDSSKWVTCAGIVYLIGSQFFEFDSKIALPCTVICGISWGCASWAAKQLEPQAQSLIEHYSNPFHGANPLG